MAGAVTGAIAVGVGGVPEEHTAVGVLAVRRRGEVSIVHAGAVLGVDDDRVVFFSAAAKVEFLEVARSLIETVPIGIA